MDALIAQEEDFQRRRALAATQGRLLERPSYTSLPHLMYTRYLVRNEDPPHVAPIAPLQKRWMDDPALTIARNASILGAPRPPAELAAVLPKLNRLLELYREEPPVLRGQRRPTVKTKYISNGDGDVEEGSDRSRPPNRDGSNDDVDDDIDGLASDQILRAIPHNSKNHPAVKHSTSTKPPPKFKSEPARTAKPRRSRLTTSTHSRIPAEHAEAWTFGPSWTSQMFSQYLGGESD
jgi:hypothetical protein